MQKKRSSSNRLAICSCLTALSVVVLIIGSWLGVAIYAAPLLAAMPLLPLAMEYGTGWALSSYAAASMLALMLCADKELALVYAFFCWYPALMPRIYRLRSPLLRTLVRLALYSVCALTMYAGIMELLGLNADLNANTRLLNAALFAAGALIFLLADRVYLVALHLWKTRFRPSMKDLL